MSNRTSRRPLTDAAIVSCIAATILLTGASFRSVYAQSMPQPVPVDKSGDYTAIENIEITRWVDPYGSQPITYAEWFAQHGIRGPFEVMPMISATAKGGDYEDKLCVIVESSLWSALEASIDLYVLDVTGEGYAVEVHTMAGGTPADVRAFLQTKYAEGTTGCMMVGDLPVPWYEIEAEAAEFPIDLFYMDMDGSFGDIDSDGMYDSHTGDVEPEIYLGRLVTSPMTLNGATEIGLLQLYFHKNHQYRCGLMPAENRALVYIDDDWEGGAPSWTMNVGEAYASRVHEYDRWITTAPDYEGRLPLDFESILVCVHSWPGGHGFKDPSETWTWTYVSEIVDIQPPAHFYNLFACSNARYVETDYCSGWYIFGPDHGLAAIGSAKTGSMLYFEDYYRPLGEGKEIGQAFLEWFVARAEGGFEEWEITWFYGMSLHGDPTLRIQKLPNNEILAFDKGAASYMMALSEPSYDLFNVRFTTDEPCTLTTVSATGIFPEVPVRMYIWESDGTYPAAKVDSVDIPDGDLRLIDISDRNLIYGAGEDFHIGFTLLDPNPAPAETLWIYMDDGMDMPEIRSGLYHDGQWKTLAQFYGVNYNFLIRVEARGPSAEEVAISPLTLPDGTAGVEYDAALDITGGTAPYSLEITSGAMPQGLAIESDGKFSGAAAETGDFHFTVGVTDASVPALADFQHYDVSFGYTCGDADNDGQVNVSDAVYIVNYIFKGGPPPVIEEAGDVNNDGTVNIADAVYLINFVFQGGPEPCCP